MQLQLIASFVALFAIANYAQGNAVPDDSLLVERASQAPTPVSAATYAELIRYATFAAAANTSSCPKPPLGTKNYRYFSAGVGGETQAISLRDDTTKEIIISFRGTDSIEDYITDASAVEVSLLPQYQNAGVCPTCLVHSGFQAAYTTIRGQIVDFLNQQLSLSNQSAYKTTIVGHSLGGSLAWLAYLDLKPQTKFRVGNGYSLGQPRTGSPATASYFDKIAGSSGGAVGTFLRITHFDDPVPKVPGISGVNILYSHSRTEIWESASVPNQATTYRCYGDEPDNCNASTGPFKPVLNTSHLTYAGLNYKTVCR